MANHNVIVANNSDSNLLHFFDMTTGDYSAVEFNHTEALDDVEMGPNGKVLLTFDGDGGNIVEGGLDGQVTEFVPGKVDSSAYWQGNLKLYNRISPDAYLRIVRKPINGEQFIIENAQGDALLKWGVNDADDGYINNQQTVSFTPDGAGAPVTGEISYFYQTSTIPDGYMLTCITAYQGYLWGVARVALTGAWDSPVELYMCKMSCADNVLTVVESWKIGDLPGQWWMADTSNIPGQSIACDDTGRFVLSTYQASNGFFFWNAGVLSAKQDIGIYDVSYEMNRQFGALNDTESYIYTVDGTSLLRDEGLTYSKFNGRNVSLVEIVIPPMAALIPAADAFVDSYDSVEGFHAVMINAYKPAGETAFVELQRMLLIELSTGQVTSKDFAGKIGVAVPCPMAETRLNDIVVISVPAFEVTGFVEYNGLKAASEVFLMDNTSMKIVGRTKSDPTTGVYKFRCWTNGKKSVLAKHPVSGGLRIAAEVTPKLAA